MNIRAKALTLAMMALGASGAALAVATPEEIKQLGTTLTPWGAIQGGLALGSIPA